MLQALIYRTVLIESMVRYCYIYFMKEMNITDHEFVPAALLYVRGCSESFANED